MEHDAFGLIPPQGTVMARAGRPPKGAEHPRRTVRRTTRLTVDEAAMLDRMAADFGMTVSDYIRWSCLPVPQPTVEQGREGGGKG